MFIIWGTRGYQKVLGQHGAITTCQHCHNDMQKEILEMGRKFTIFWIPLFKMGRKYFLACPICHYGHELTKEQMEALVK